jgi:hypothetical protein
MILRSRDRVFYAASADDVRRSAESYAGDPFLLDLQQRLSAANLELLHREIQQSDELVDNSKPTSAPSPFLTVIPVPVVLAERQRHANVPVSRPFHPQAKRAAELLRRATPVRKRS